VVLEDDKICACHGKRFQAFSCEGSVYSAEEALLLCPIG